MNWPKGVPNPGSDEAKDLGCSCPVLDNGRGKGFPFNGKTSWWITQGCPLHGKATGETSA